MSDNNQCSVLNNNKFCARGSRPSSTWRLQVQIVFSTCTSKMYNCTVSLRRPLYCESEKIKTLSQPQLSASHMFVNLQKPVVAKFIIHQQTWNFPISCLLITWLPFDILKSYWICNIGTRLNFEIFQWLQSKNIQSIWSSVIFCQDFHDIFPLLLWSGSCCLLSLLLTNPLVKTSPQSQPYLQKNPF